MSRLSAAVTLAALAASSLLTAPAAGASTAPVSTMATTSCMTDQYVTKIKDVSGNETIGLTRVKAKTYPGRTTITKDHREYVATDRVLKVDLAHTSEASLGASAIIKKVVNIYGSITGRTELKASFQSTRSESSYVSSHVKMVIPGGVSVAWFKGWRSVGGSFRFSFCHHYSGMPTYVGVVEWRTGRFHTYGYTSSGGQRCDVKAYEPVARAAKKAVCL